MRIMLLGFAASLGLLASQPPAQAIGCFTGAMAGGVAGHMAGHGILGAIGGCIAGHQYHKYQLKQDDMQTRDQYIAAQKQQNPNYKSPWTD
jgi:uncharacterized protein YcfJ